MDISSQPILEVENLHVEVGGNEVLKGINLVVKQGETHILFGPNGSGKSTFIKTIMGLSDCKVTEGTIRFLGQDITNATISDRSIMGIGMLFQSPPEIEGLPLNRLVAAAFSENSEEYISKMSETTTMSDYLTRDLNVGFSGGERKRCEAFQLLLQKPLLSMLDEPESGVDLQSVRVLGKALSSLQNCDVGGCRSATIIITHTGGILEYMHGTIAHVLIDGHISCTGNEYVFLRMIETDGFDHFRKLKCDKKCGKCCEKPKHTMYLKELEEFEEHQKEGKDGGKSTSLLESFLNSSSIEKRDIEVKETKENEGKRVSILDKVDLVSDDAFVEESSSAQPINQDSDVLKIDVTDEVYGGSYVQRDQTIENYESFEDGIEVLSLAHAIKKYDWFESKYMWRALSKDKNDVTRAVAENDVTSPTGYAIIAHPGAHSVRPINSQLIMENHNMQYVHNVLIAMPGSSLTVASFCTYNCSSKSTGEVVGGQHYGVSEFYVENDAQLCFSMIHVWCNAYVALPVSAAIVEDNGVFYSNYVCLQPVVKVKMCPVVDLRGKNSVAKFSSVLLAKEGTELDVGSLALLNGEGSKTESITRTISKGGTIYARADIHGNAPNTKGHIECQGLVISENKGMIYSVPQISGGYGTELSHEAAIGRIAKDKIEYLMSRRLTEEMAVSVIIRGFLNLKVEGIPKSIQDQMDEIIDQASKEGF